jgi:hypothetical protein
MVTRSSFSVINRYRYFVFTTATEENPVLHKHVVTNGSKTCTALCDNHGYSFYTGSQNRGSLSASNKSFK